jgi:hypothetical protein
MSDPKPSTPDLVTEDTNVMQSSLQRIAALLNQGMKAITSRIALPMIVRPIIGADAPPVAPRTIDLTALAALAKAEVAKAEVLQKTKKKKAVVADQPISTPAQGVEDKALKNRKKKNRAGLKRQAAREAKKATATLVERIVSESPTAESLTAEPLTNEPLTNEPLTPEQQISSETSVPVINICPADLSEKRETAVTEETPLFLKPEQNIIDTGKLISEETSATLITNSPVSSVAAELPQSGELERGEVLQEWAQSCLHSLGEYQHYVTMLREKIDPTKDRIVAIFATHMLDHINKIISRVNKIASVEMVVEQAVSAAMPAENPRGQLEKLAQQWNKFVAQTILVLQANDATAHHEFQSILLLFKNGYFSNHLALPAENLAYEFIIKFFDDATEIVEQGSHVYCRGKLPRVDMDIELYYAEGDPNIIFENIKEKLRKVSIFREPKKSFSKMQAESTHLNFSGFLDFPDIAESIRVDFKVLRRSPFCAQEMDHKNNVASGKLNLRTGTITYRNNDHPAHHGSAYLQLEDKLLCRNYSFSQISTAELADILHFDLRCFAKMITAGYTYPELTDYLRDPEHYKTDIIYDMIKIILSKVSGRFQGFHFALSRVDFQPLLLPGIRMFSYLQFVHEHWGSLSDQDTKSIPESVQYLALVYFEAWYLSGKRQAVIAHLQRIIHQSFIRGIEELLHAMRKRIFDPAGSNQQQPGEIYDHVAHQLIENFSLKKYASFATHLPLYQSIGRAARSQDRRPPQVAPREFFKPVTARLAPTPEGVPAKALSKLNPAAKPFKFVPSGQ